jgi:hypothetical protein
MPLKMRMSAASVGRDRATLRSGVSYDLYLFDCAPGDDPDELHERLEQLTDEDEQSGSDPDVDARNRRIAETLMSAHPQFSESEIEEGREFELSDPDGLQISLYGQQAAITFPYWDSLDARKLMAQVRDASRIINAATGWCLFDPQVERVVDPARESVDITAAFDHGREQLRRVVGGEPARPWWKRLFGARRV